MGTIRVVAISTESAEKIRAASNDPQFGFPIHTSITEEGIPCRHCLQYIAEGREMAKLFTLDPFAGLEDLPLPGPVYIHAEPCERYPEDGGIPRHLMNSRRTLNAYGRGRRLLSQKYVQSENAEAVIEQLFSQPEVDYVHVRSTTAGCYTFRLERADGGR